MSQESFAKRQREKARNEKAAEKAARRAERNANDEVADTAPAEPVDEQALLAELAELHERFENDDIEFDDFMAAKEEITEKLQIQ